MTAIGIIMHVIGFVTVSHNLYKIRQEYGYIFIGLVLLVEGIIILAVEK